MLNVIEKARSSHLFKQLLIYHISVQSRYLSFSGLLTVITIYYPCYITGLLKFIEGMKCAFQIEKKINSKKYFKLKKY